MNRPSGPRKTANLSQSTNHQLHMYALAASAAGVGILALAQAAEAKIVYTPANVSINPHVPYKLDLNHDRIADFTFSIYTFSHSGSGGREFFATMIVGGAQKSNAEVVGSKGLARAFGPGRRIGLKAAVKGYALMGHCLKQVNSMSSVDTSRGNWLNVTNRYLGLRFTVKGKTHFGWARLTVAGCAVNANLTGYAYETIPNKPIVTGKTKGPDHASIEESNSSLNLPTPQPPTLGALATGTPGLSIWRRKESIVATQ
jgi:hypothetical protein